MLVTIQLNRFIDMLRAAESESDITVLLDEFTRWLGFERFAMGHHVDLARPPRDAFRATNYDPAWINQVIEARYFADDPIHIACARRGTGFRWDSIDFRKMPERQQTIIEQARRRGLAAGYTVPVNLPGEYAGTCSFAGPSYDKVCALTLTLSDIFVGAAFEQVRLLIERRDGRAPRSIPRLQPRHLQAVILVGRGKTDPEIGDIMNITKNTAHSYVEHVRKDYGGISRPSLMLRALFDNQFTFGDAFGR